GRHTRFSRDWSSDVCSSDLFVVTGTDAADVLAGAFAGHPNEIEEGRAARLAALREGSIDDLALVARTGGISYIVAGEPGRRMATDRKSVVEGKGGGTRVWRR